MEVKIMRNEETRTVNGDTLIVFAIDSEAEEGNRMSIRAKTLYAGEKIDKYAFGGILAELCAGLVTKTFKDNPIFVETTLHIMSEMLAKAGEKTIKDLFEKFMNDKEGRR